MCRTSFVVDRNRRSKRDKGLNGNEFSDSSFRSQYVVSCYFSIDSAHIRLTVHVLIEHSWKRRDRMIYEYDVYARAARIARKMDRKLIRYQTDGFLIHYPRYTLRTSVLFSKKRSSDTLPDERVRFRK